MSKKSPTPVSDHGPVWRAAAPYMRARKNDVHIPIAYDYALQLVAHFPDADHEVVLLAILLHDIGWAVVDQEAIFRDGFGPKMMESDVRIAHEKEGARLAREILEGLDYDAGLIDRVVEIIDGHDTRKQAMSLEDELVKDADALWRFSIAGVGIGADWVKMTPGQTTDRVEPYIENLLNTDTARMMARRELDNTRRVLRTAELATDEATA